MAKDSFQEGKWVFSLGPICKTKTKAKQKAQIMANQGYRYRIRKVDGGYGVYAAGGKKRKKR